MTEYFSSHSWIIWSIITVLLAILELTTGGFYIMCLAFGAFITIPMSLITSNTFVLISTFSIASLFALFFIKPVLVRKGEKDIVKSNVSALIGTTGVVSETIEENGYGRVKAGGDDWKAQTEDGTPLLAGTKIQVIKQDSVIVTVRKIKTKQEESENVFYLDSSTESGNQSTSL